MNTLAVIREIKFVMMVLAVSAISMIGYTVLYPERLFESDGVYLDYLPPSGE